MTCLAIIGVGRIGGEVAFLAAATGVADRLILHDTYAPLLRAQVLDLRHTGLDIEISTDISEIKSADIAVFAAGTPRNPSIRSRADLLDANRPVVTSCAAYLKGFSGTLITVTNPMDVNNYFLYRKTGLERSQCIGFGGQLDSARFADVLHQEGIGGPACVLGEHGDHQVPLFHLLDEPVGTGVREKILARLKNSSMEVIKGKGGTVFGPAYHITRLIRAIKDDTREVLPCSCVLDGEWDLTGCSICVPAQIGREGIVSIQGCDLDDWERDKFARAGAFLGQLCRRFNE